MHRIFPSLRAKFHADKLLKKLGRELYYGLEGEKVKGAMPQVEVTNTTAHDDWDTFDTDETVFNLTFTVRAKRTQQMDGRRCAEAMQSVQRVYVNQAMSGGEFTSTDCMKVSTDGPFVRDGIDEGQVVVNLPVCWRVLTPSVRGS